MYCAATPILWGIYLPVTGIWTDFVTCFDQQNMAEVMLCQYQTKACEEALSFFAYSVELLAGQVIKLA